MYYKKDFSNILDTQGDEICTGEHVFPSGVVWFTPYKKKNSCKAHSNFLSFISYFSEAHGYGSLTLLGLIRDVCRVLPYGTKNCVIQRERAREYFVYWEGLFG